MPEHRTYTKFPLGDSAITIDFGNYIDESVNQKVLALFHSLKVKPFQGMIETVPAYSSLTIYYDLIAVKKGNPEFKTAFEAVSKLIDKMFSESKPETISSSRFVKIPVCYDKEFGLDLDKLAEIKGITTDEVIHIHTSKSYRVYMLGFIPGFSYMGTLDERISVPRKQHPRLRVEAGSVGIAGLQTGIYPLASPGGWQIIGRTPLKLFIENSDELTLLKPGDMVQFISITKDEFNSY